MVCAPTVLLYGLTSPASPFNVIWWWCCAINWLTWSHGTRLKGKAGVELVCWHEDWHHLEHSDQQKGPHQAGKQASESPAGAGWAGEQSVLTLQMLSSLMAPVTRLPGKLQCCTLPAWRITVTILRHGSASDFCLQFWDIYCPKGIQTVLWRGMKLSEELNRVNIKKQQSKEDSRELTN